MLDQQLIFIKENQNINKLVIMKKISIIKFMFINSLDKMVVGIIGQWLKYKNILVKIKTNYLNMKDNGSKH